MGFLLGVVIEKIPSIRLGISIKLDVKMGDDKEFISNRNRPSPPSSSPPPPHHRPAPPPSTPSPPPPIATSHPPLLVFSGPGAWGESFPISPPVLLFRPGMVVGWSPCWVFFNPGRRCFWSPRDVRFRPFCGFSLITSSFDFFPFLVRVSSEVLDWCEHGPNVFFFPLFLLSWFHDSSHNPYWFLDLWI